jgi:O-antigen/teichoic acid export membrane protein
MKKSLSFYTIFYLGSLLIMRGSGVLAKILLARAITPYEYGLITLFIISLPGLFQDVTNFCFFDIMGHATEGKKYFGFSLLYGMLATVVLAVIFLIFHSAIFSFLNIPPEYWDLLYIVLFGVLLSVTLGGVITGLLRGVRNHSVAAAFSAAPSILRVVFIALAVYLFQINDFFIICLLFALPPLAALIPIFVFKFRVIVTSLSTITLPSKKILFFGFSFFILNLWVGISQQINSVMISHDLGIVWQGYFDISLSLAAVITFFSSAVYLISAPESTADTSQTELLHKKGGLGEVGRLLFCMCLLSVLILYFYSLPLVTLLFTSGYAVSANYLYILAIGYAVLFVQQYTAFLNISKEEGFSSLTWVTLISIALFPLFTHLMILQFGFIGAYLSTTIFMFVYTMFTVYLAKDRTPLKILFSGIERLAAATGITFLVLVLFPLSLVPGIVLCSVIFMILVITLGYLDKHIITDLMAS